MIRFGKCIVSGAMLLCVFTSVKAQDSTARFHSTLFQQQYNSLTADVLGQPLLERKDYTSIEAGFKLKAGGYHQVQDAPRQSDVSFRTDGTRVMGKYLATGYFSYERSLQDSVAYTLRYDLDEPAPFYLYAGKRGNWEAGIYNLMGTVSRPIGDRITVTAGARYRGLNAWRSNDPRSEYFRLDLSAQAGLHYKISSKHIIGVAGGLSKRNMETKINYTNADYQFNTNYREYITYLQYGYGFTEPRADSRNILSDSRGWDWQAIYHGKTRIGDFTIRGGFRAMDSKFYMPGTSSSLPFTFGRYYDDIITASFLWNYQRAKGVWSANAAFNSHDGYEFTVQLNGNNYRYISESFSLQPLYTRMIEGRVKWDAGIVAALSSLYKADGTTGVRADFQYADIAVRGNGYFYIKNENLLRFGAEFGSRQSVASSLRLPSQTTDFIQNVVTPDARYFQSSTMFGGLNALYAFNINRVSLFTSVSGQYLSAQLPTITEQVPTTPGDNRWWWKLSIGITL